MAEDCHRQAVGWWTPQKYLANHDGKQNAGLDRLHLVRAPRAFLDGKEQNKSVTPGGIHHSNAVTSSVIRDHSAQGGNVVMSLPGSPEGSGLLLFVSD